MEGTRGVPPSCGIGKLLDETHLVSCNRSSACWEPSPAVPFSCLFSGEEHNFSPSSCCDNGCQGMGQGPISVTSWGSHRGCNGESGMKETLLDVLLNRRLSSCKAEGNLIFGWMKPLCCAGGGWPLELEPAEQVGPWHPCWHGAGAGCWLSCRAARAEGSSSCVFKMFSGPGIVAHPGEWDGCSYTNVIWLL